LGSWEGWEGGKLKLPEKSKKYRYMKNHLPTHPDLPKINNKKREGKHFNNNKRWIYVER
jgi:hypothetical protein